MMKHSGIKFVMRKHYFSWVNIFKKKVVLLFDFLLEALESFTT
jgi:hypothetical protein